MYLVDWSAVKEFASHFAKTRSDKSVFGECTLCGCESGELLAHQLLGENHPEGEQSDKGSGGGDGYH